MLTDTKDAEMVMMAAFYADERRIGSHPFLRGRFGDVNDCLDGKQEFGTCWDMVWIYEDSTGQAITVWWASVPKFCFYMMIGFFRCWWLQAVRRWR